MKLLIAIALMAFGAVAHAGNITCLDKTQEIADKKVAEAIFKNIEAALNKKGIQLSPDSNSVSIRGAQIVFEADGVYGYFNLGIGLLTTADGTELIAEYKMRDWDSYKDAANAYYKPVLTKRGYDKEGNAIGGHCTLLADGVRVTDRAELIMISNTKTGRVVSKVALPTKISLY